MTRILNIFKLSFFLLALQFYTVKKKWEVEPGDFDLWVGSDSRASLKASFIVVE